MDNFVDLVVVTRTEDEPFWPDAVSTAEILIRTVPWRAYSEIRQLAPRLVMVCLDLDCAEMFQLLTMLQADGATRAIPLVVFVARPGCEAPRAATCWRTAERPHEPDPSGDRSLASWWSAPVMH